MIKEFYYNNGIIKYIGECKKITNSVLKFFITRIANKVGSGVFYDSFPWSEDVSSKRKALFCFNGKGKLYYGDGTLWYEGDFNNGLYHGYGKRYHPDGSLSYEGKFKQHFYHGFGVLYGDKNRIIYQGSFKHGNFHGSGKLYDDQQRIVYIGSFSKHKFHGWGRYYEYDSDTSTPRLIREGYFRNGIFVEKNIEI